MKNELLFTYPLYVDISMCSAEGTITPTGYQRMAVETIGKHLENIEIDSPCIATRLGVVWVLLSMSIELKRPIRVGERLTMQTWHTDSKPPAYRRDFAIFDAAGERAAVGATFSSLIDVNTRRLSMDKNILAGFDLAEGEKLLHADKRFAEHHEYAAVEERFVRPSFIDGLGHVNNERYGEFVYDALTKEERSNIGSLKRMDVFFKAELTEGECFRMERAENGNAVIMRGIHATDGREAFIMKLTF
ncbi:MAG: hypothetical protein E7330_05335 [Clostridiales bacterium]|nr:hypothetical protein [Clostridiales bacterium]